MNKKSGLISFGGAGIAALVLALASPDFAAPSGTPGTLTFLVQAEDAEVAARLVTQTGGQVSDPLPIINAVGATLTPEQVRRLRANPGVRRVYANSSVEISARRVKVRDSATPAGRDETLIAEAESTTTTDPVTADLTQSTTTVQDWKVRDAASVEIHHTALAGASDLPAAGIDGDGVTVAILDTGVWFDAAIDRSRFYGTKDFTGDYTSGDHNGHGTHLAGIISSDRMSANGVYEGIAPAANFLAVRAFAEDGCGSYLSVIKALDWIVANRKRLKIRVLNLSFTAPPQSFYWDDPLNQAVMAAWQAGITVVVSAGNAGPDPMTVGVPGNVPYVITVGAMTDSYTPYDLSDDRLTSFSSAGPTYEGFVKPELVAPGGHITSWMPWDAYIPTRHPESMLPTEMHFEMSGTSQAAAVVSGIAALMLQQDRSLTPDDVKCRLMSTARPALNADGRLAYSVFQQGAGLVNAMDAVYSSATGCANQGLDIARDLAGEQHYGGPANMDDLGRFYVMEVEEPGDGNDYDSGETEMLNGDGYVWSRGYIWGQGFIWSQGYVWSQGFIWSQGYIWGQGYVWSQSQPWQEQAVFSDSLGEVMSINSWVEHE